MMQTWYLHHPHQHAQTNPETPTAALLPRGTCESDRSFLRHGPLRRGGTAIPAGGQAQILTNKQVTQPIYTRLVPESAAMAQVVSMSSSSAMREAIVVFNPFASFLKTSIDAMRFPRSNREM